MEGFMEVELMVTKRDDDDDDRPTTDRQGEYRAICLGKVGRQSFAIANIMLPEFNKLYHSCVM